MVIHMISLKVSDTYFLDWLRALLFSKYFFINLKVAGIGIGIVGEEGIKTFAQEEKIFVGMVLALIFIEALGLYGLIMGLILASNK